MSRTLTEEERENLNGKLTEELESFNGLWKGGFFEGDPLHPMGTSRYGQVGFMSVLHATYLRCIKPYINSQTVSLEIGPGRGAWTKALLPSQEVYVLDALPEEHNRFFEYLGYPKHVKYFQVKDFKYEMLPDNYFNYLFSFGALCHVSFDGIRAYATNIYPKLKGGSHCFWMVADYDKYNQAVSNIEELSMWSIAVAALESKSRKYRLLKRFFRYLITRYLIKRSRPHRITADENDLPQPGRWYHAGIERACSMLQECGYQIIDPDVGTLLRDPIIHFMKA